eukprot:3696178-Alexandrium_andersonii.AAC.1
MASLDPLHSSRLLILGDSRWRTPRMRAMEWNGMECACVPVCVCACRFLHSGIAGLLIIPGPGKKSAARQELLGAAS